MKETSRFYREKYPQIDSFVMAEILNVDDLGAECQLLEYGNIPAYMGVSQFSRKWIKSIRQVAKAGSKEILQVIGVNPVTGTVDLSKKMITDAEIEKGLEDYRKSKKYHSIIQRLAETTNTPIETMYETFGWKLYDDNQIDRIHPLDIMEKSLSDVSVWNKYDIPTELKDQVIVIVLKKIHLAPQKYEMDLNVSCYNENAIDTLQLIFKKLTEQGVVCIIKSSPIYTIGYTGVTPEEAIDKLNAQAELVKQIATSHQCTFDISKDAHNVIE
jgi:translation initiation factor 2 subunit 1